jgi:hypothetical protein
MARKVSINRKKLFRTMRDHGVSKKKAKKVLADVSGSGKGKARRHGIHPVSAVKGGVHHLGRH